MVKGRTCLKCGEAHFSTQKCAVKKTNGIPYSDAQAALASTIGQTIINAGRLASPPFSLEKLEAGQVVEVNLETGLVTAPSDLLRTTNSDEILARIREKTRLRVARFKARKKELALAQQGNVA